MRKFNQIISVAFAVDAVTTMLLEKIDKSFPHRELLVETIITPLILTGNDSDMIRLGNIMSAMFGHKAELDFVVGQVVECSEKVYKNNERVMIGRAVVLKVEPLKDRNHIQVEYTYLNNKGVEESGTQWVSKESLTIKVCAETAVVEMTPIEGNSCDQLANF
jgi:hypothetical protein